MRTISFASIKRAEARERMAALRRARQSRRAARAEQNAAGLLNGSVGRIRNLRRVLDAMSEYAE